MKNLMVLLVTALISFSALGQSKFHAANNIADISFTSKGFKADPIRYNVVEKFGRKMYLMPDETGQSSLPFQVAFYEDLEKMRNLSTGKQKMVPTKIYVAVPFLNCKGAHVDEFHPAGLKAELKRKRRGKVYIENGDYMYESPERLNINGQEYFLFQDNQQIVICPLDGDMQDKISMDTKYVSFINVNDFYLLEEYDPKKHKTSVNKNIGKFVAYEPGSEEPEPEVKEESPVVQGDVGNSSESTFLHVVKEGENLTEIARKYCDSVEGIKERNNLCSDRILPGQKLLIQRTQK